VRGKVVNAKELTYGRRGGADRCGPALAGNGTTLADGPALAGLWAGFSQFRLFRDLNFWYSSAFFGVKSGFFRVGVLREKFVNLGRNLDEKLTISGEIQGSGARKFVEM
jgi:hypothetical protein